MTPPWAVHFYKTDFVGSLLSENENIYVFESQTLHLLLTDGIIKNNKTVSKNKKFLIFESG